MKIDITPLVSVVIPTYNRSTLLLRAIASVCTQTFTNWELYVVDDGSIDDTIAVVQSIPDSRVHLIQTEHTGNVAALRNAGAREARGEWLAFLDSDDLWLEDKLTLQLDALTRSGGDWCYGGYELVSDEEQRLPHQAHPVKPVSYSLPEALLRSKADICVCTVMIRRRLFEELGGFNVQPELLYREDYELMLRLSLTRPVTVAPGLMAQIREHAARSTRLAGDGHQRTARLLKHFIHTQPASALKKIARRRLAYHLAETAAARMNASQYWRAMPPLCKAIVRGDKWRHLLSVLRRGIFKRNKLPA